MESIRVVLLFKILAMVAAAAETWPVSKPGCPDSCGNISIPYPYGIGQGCFREGFEITCKSNDERLLRPFYGDIEVIDIYLLQGKVHMFTNVCSRCYNQYLRIRNFLPYSPPLDLTHIPIVLDWAIRTETTCEEAEGNTSSYACKSSHSKCINSTNGNGYLCNCSAGYQGNPYLPNGCQDIDECSDKEMYPCFGICRNTPGSYECLCPPGAHGDPRIGCSSQPSLLRTIIITSICVGGGILLLLAASVLLIRKVKQKNIRKRRDKFFHKNRGFLLQQLISSDEAPVERMKIFTLEELESATNNFDSARIVGKGGHGMVYKGILSDQRIVAIKKSKITNQSEIDQFINEVVILSQINHRNVVKLYGCCLEHEVPLLVYEFISGGTLFDLLHVRNNISILSLEDRLRIAIEIASALAYLHTAASISIFHRDVKSSNILLNENYDAKVSDFGASRSVPLNQTSITTAVQGTFGYLDPEYFQRCHLTEKSDVYSFGVILLELLTRKTPISNTRPEEERNLAMHFIYSLKQNCLFQILDPHLIEVGEKEDIEELARLAEMCLRLKGEERPTMKEIEQKLDHIRRLTKRKQKDERLQNNDLAMGMQGKSLTNSGPPNITGQYSLEKSLYYPLIYHSDSLHIEIAPFDVL